MYDILSQLTFEFTVNNIRLTANTGLQGLIDIYYFRNPMIHKVYTLTIIKLIQALWRVSLRFNSRSEQRAHKCL